MVVAVMVVVFLDGEAAQATIKQYQDSAFVIVDQCCNFLVEAKDEPGNVELLRKAIQKFELEVQEDNGGFLQSDIGVYDCKLAGESVTHPHLRTCNWRAEHYEKLTRAFLRSQLPEDNDIITKGNVAKSTMVMVFDGGKNFGRFCHKKIYRTHLQ